MCYFHKYVVIKPWYQYSFIESLQYPIFIYFFYILTHLTCKTVVWVGINPFPLPEKLSLRELK